MLLKDQLSSVICHPMSAIICVNYFLERWLMSHKSVFSNYLLAKRVGGWSYKLTNLYLSAVVLTSVKGYWPIAISVNVNLYQPLCCWLVRQITNRYNWSRSYSVLHKWLLLVKGMLMLVQIEKYTCFR